jgi:hypothetical protein
LQNPGQLNYAVREKKIIVNNSLSIITVTKFEEEKNTIKGVIFKTQMNFAKTSPP